MRKVFLLALASVVLLLLLPALLVGAPVLSAPCLYGEMGIATVPALDRADNQALTVPARDWRTSNSATYYLAEQAGGVHMGGAILTAIPDSENMEYLGSTPTCPEVQKYSNLDVAMRIIFRTAIRGAEGGATNMAGDEWQTIGTTLNGPKSVIICISTNPDASITATGGDSEV